MPIVDVTKLANVFKLHPKYVHTLVKEGMPQESRGRYDLGKCMLWYIYYLQAAVRKRRTGGEDGEASEREARRRMAEAEATLKEMEVAKERGQLVTLIDFEKMMADLIVNTKTRFLALPARVAPQLVNESSQLLIQERLDAAVKDALAALAHRNGNSNTS